MNHCYQHNDSTIRGYQGIQFSEGECDTILTTSVRNNLIDIDETGQMAADFSALQQKGFSSANLVADMEALQKSEPEDLRDWRIGEAMCQVVLGNHFGCRFHWNERRDTRNPRGNKVGADVVGFIDTDNGVLFMFGETKTSSETVNRPPQAMTKDPGGMESQLKELFRHASVRRLLISYLGNKTRGLDANHPFKVDYLAALRTYYGAVQAYQLMGVLVRDVEPHENDIRPSYHRLKAVICEPVGLRLLAIYTCRAKSNWKEIIERG